MSEFYPTDTIPEPILHHVYALVDPRDLRVRYIGVTVKSLNTRLCGHLADGRKIKNGKPYYNYPRATWIRELTELGQKPIIVLIETTEYRNRELFWIVEYRMNGAMLTNSNDGGSGVVMHTEETKRKIGIASTGRRHTTESKLKVSLANKGKPIGLGIAKSRAAVEKAKRFGADHHAFGTKLSEDHKEKCRIASTGKIHSEETKQKIAASHIGIRPSEETKRKISNANTGKKRLPRDYPPLSEERKRKMSEAGRGRIHSEETKRKISESNKGRVVTEEMRLRISNTMTGRKLPEEHIRNASNALRGGKRSEETKAKMRAAMRAAWERRRNENISDEETRKKNNS